MLMMMGNHMKKPPFDITLPEYQKIFRILHAFGELTNRGRPNCLFYNVTGCRILREVYGIDARPVMGAAFIMTNDIDAHVLHFANLETEAELSDRDHFQCWIETRNNIIDFTAPIYDQYPSSVGKSITTRKMFQKPHIQMSQSHLALDRLGDFYFEPNRELTRALLLAGAESPRYLDLADIARDWAMDSKKTVKRSIRIGSDEGPVDLTVSDLALIGGW